MQNPATAAEPHRIEPKALVVGGVQP